MAERGLFVDFMYAVTVGAALPRLDEKALHFRSPLLWGLLFLVAVFLEDFYLYHVKVVPHLPASPSARGFILAMLIIATWYLSQSAFPSNPRLFLVSFGLFFLLKWLGGFVMRLTAYPSRIDTVFLLPVVAAFGLAFSCDSTVFASRPGWLLIVLIPVWLLTVTLWWCLTSAAHPATPALPTH
jgi:hypothetical protein